MRKQDDRSQLENFDDDIEDAGHDPDESLLVEFLGAWENEDEFERRQVILNDYCATHRHLEEDFRGLVEARGGIDRVAFVAAREEHDPERLGPYRVLRLLAYGGMGKVYEAEDETLARRVAVKTIRVGRAADPKLLEQFKAEREALALLHDTNIVPIFSAGEEDGLFYFAMPLIKGITLADLVEAMSKPGAPRSGEGTSTPASSSWPDLIKLAQSTASHRQTVRRLSGRFGLPFSRPSSPAPPPAPNTCSTARPLDYERRVAEIVAVAAEAIHSAHEAGVLHLDVKPSNILIEPVSKSDGDSLHPWVIDFGLVNVVENRNGENQAASAEPGRRTRGFGTKGFMAPEMIVTRETPDDHRPPIARATDIWSLGVTLYQLLTLHLPFPGDQQTTGPDAPCPPRCYVPGLSSELEEVVLKALRKNPEERYATAAEFAKDLRRWLAGVPTVAGEADYAERLVMWAKRRPAVAFATGMTAAFVLVACLGAGQAFRRIQAEAATAQRELDLITLARLRAPVRSGVWFEKAWGKVRDLAAGRPERDGRFQGQITTLLEGLDVRLAKSFDEEADGLAFDPKGKRLLTIKSVKGPDGRDMTRLVMHDLAGQKGSTEVIVPEQGVVGFLKNEPLFLGVDRSDPSILRLRDANTGLEKTTLKSPLNGPSMVTARALSRDGTCCVAIVRPVAAKAREPIGNSATIVVWDLSQGKIVNSIEETRAFRHEDVVLSPDGSLLAVWDADGPRHDVAVWGASDGALLGKFSTVHNVITSVAFGRDPVWRDDVKSPRWRLAVGESGGMITVWDLSSRTVKSLERGSINDIKALDFSRDGASLASAGRNELRFWDPASGECLLKVTVGNLQSAVAFSPDDRRLVVANLPLFGFARSVDVYDLEKGRGLRTLRGLQQRIEKVAVSLDGRRIAALTNDWELGVFDATSGDLIGLAEAPEGISPDNAAIALNADGTRLAYSAGTTAKLWDVETRRPLRAWALPPALTEAAGFRPDGRLILIRQETLGAKLPPDSRAPRKDHPRVCRAYELPEQGDPKKTAEITDFNWYVEHIAATPDAAYFAIQGNGTATGELARIIHLYDGLTGKRVGAITTTFPPDASSTLMRFDPKGTRLRVARDIHDPERQDIFEIPSLKVTGSARVLPAINVGGSRSVSHFPESTNAPRMLVLSEQGRATPLLRVVRDIEVTGSGGITFSPDGNSFIWGNQDGTVTVCDLNEVQLRLTDVRLGW